MDPGFSPIRIRTLKPGSGYVHFSLCLSLSFFNKVKGFKWMFFVYVSEEPDQKGKCWEYQIWFTIFFFFLYLQFLGRFFMYPDPDFQDRIWIFWPILIRTQEKSLIQIRTKGPWSETLNKRCHHSPVEQCWPPPGPGSGTVFPALVSLKHNNICKCNTQKVLKTIKSKSVMWILIHYSCIRIQKFAPILTRFRIRIRAVSHGYMINFISTIYYLKTIF